MTDLGSTVDRIKMSRVWAMPNKWTFQIKPIRQLLRRYVGDGKGWIDPFAGFNSPAETTNDLNPTTPTNYHLDAIEFLKQADGRYGGGLRDAGGRGGHGGEGVGGEN